MPKRIYTRQTPDVKLTKLNIRIAKMEATLDKKQRRLAELYALSMGYRAQVAERNAVDRLEAQP